MDADIFLSQNGWQNAEKRPLTPDWSSRRYQRLSKGQHTAIFLQCPPDSSPNATPGHKLGDLIRINAYLRGMGFSAPECYAANLDQGFALLEDFGDTPLTQGTALDRTLAIECIIELQREAELNLVQVPNYAETHLPKKLNAYAKHILGEPELDLEFLCRIEKPVFSLVDFRSGNVQLLSHKSSIQRIGLLDVQGAVTGDAVYDLVTFLEDVRISMPDEEKQRLQSKFFNNVKIPSFASCYPRWQFVFQAGVLGQLAAKNDPSTIALQNTIKARLTKLAANPLLAASVIKDLIPNFSNLRLVQ